MHRRAHDSPKADKVSAHSPSSSYLSPYVLSAPKRCEAKMLANPSSRPCCSQFLQPKSSKLFLFRNSHRNLTSRKSKFGSLSLLLSTKNALGFSVRALADPSVSDAVVSDASHSFPQPYSVKILIGDRHVSL